MSLSQAYGVFKQKNDEINECNCRIIGFEPTDHVLNEANRLLVSRQQAVLQEQRFHLLFQILSIGFHELNQPLTSLLGNIELLGFTRKTPEKLEENLNRIEEAGKRLSKTIKEIQKIRNDVSPPRVNLLKTPQTARKTSYVLVLVESDGVYEKIKTALAHVPALIVSHAKTHDLALAVMNEKSIRLALIDDQFLSSPGIGMLKKIFYGIPIVVLSGNSAESAIFRAIEEGAEDFIDKAGITGPSLLGVMHHAIQTAEMKTLLGSAFDQLAGISPRDRSTGLFQGRFFKDAVEREMVKADRNGSSFFICKVRVHDFKEILAIEGSETADLLVQDLSKMIEQDCGAICVCRQEINSLAFISPSRPAADQGLCGSLEMIFTQYLRGRLVLPANTHAEVKIAWYTPYTWCSCNELIQQIA
jgi:DNA-binding NarL/FixJ family response regulator